MNLNHYEAMVNVVRNPEGLIPECVPDKLHLADKMMELVQYARQLEAENEKLQRKQHASDSWGVIDL